MIWLQSHYVQIQNPMWKTNSLNSTVCYSTNCAVYHRKIVPCWEFYAQLFYMPKVLHCTYSIKYCTSFWEFKILLPNQSSTNPSSKFVSKNELHTVGHIKIWATTNSVIIMGIWSWDDYFQMFLHCCGHQSAASSAFIMLSTFTNFLESRTIYKHSNLYSPSYLLLPAAKVIWM